MTLSPLAERILGSRALAALTSPHGVDRYLELVNPMWAATEVRARVVDVTRETSGEHPVATLTLQPTSTWRGHRAGQYVQVGVEINGARRTTRCFSISSAESGPGERFTITVRAHEEARPGQQRVSRFLVREAQPGQIAAPEPGPGRVHAHREPGHADQQPPADDLRRLRHHPGDVPDPDPAAGRVRRQGQPQGDLPALRALRGGPDLRRRAPAHPVGGQPRRRAPEVRRRRLQRRVARASGARLPRHRHLGLRPGPDDAAGHRGVRRVTAPAHRVLQDAASSRPDPPRATSPSPGPARAPPTPGPRSSSRRRPPGSRPEYGCRMGICFSCVSRKGEGTVRNVLTGEESSLPDEDIRICVSAPVGDCAVDL